MKLFRVMVVFEKAAHRSWGSGMPREISIWLVAMAESEEEAKQRVLEFLTRPRPNGIKHMTAEALETPVAHIR